MTAEPACLACRRVERRPGDRVEVIEIGETTHRVEHATCANCGEHWESWDGAPWTRAYAGESKATFVQELL